MQPLGSERKNLQAQAGPAKKELAFSQPQIWYWASITIIYNCALSSFISNVSVTTVWVERGVEYHIPSRCSLRLFQSAFSSVQLLSKMLIYFLVGWINAQKRRRAGRVTSWTSNPPLTLEVTWPHVCIASPPWALQIDRQVRECWCMAGDYIFIKVTCEILNPITFATYKSMHPSSSSASITHG